MKHNKQMLLILNIILVCSLTKKPELQV